MAHVLFHVVLISFQEEGKGEGGGSPWSVMFQSVLSQAGARTGRSRVGAATEAGRTPLDNGGSRAIDSPSPPALPKS